LVLPHGQEGFWKASLNGKVRNKPSWFCTTDKPRRFLERFFRWGKCEINLPGFTSWTNQEGFWKVSLNGEV
jgi:hypothetical protein